MKPKEMNKINQRIQEFKNTFQPAKLPNTRLVITSRRNQSKRQSRKRRDIK